MGESTIFVSSRFVWQKIFLLGYPNNHPRRSVSFQHFDGLDLRWPTSRWCSWCWSCCSWSLLRCWANWSQNQMFSITYMADYETQPFILPIISKHMLGNWSHNQMLGNIWLISVLKQFTNLDYFTHGFWHKKLTLVATSNFQCWHLQNLNVTQQNSNKHPAHKNTII